MPQYQLESLKQSGFAWVELTLPIPLVAALLFSAEGEPRYISFFRLTPGVASSVSLSIFWHFEQTMFTSCESACGIDSNPCVVGREKDDYLIKMVCMLARL